MSKKWKNWAGNVRFTSKCFFTPTSLPELQAVVLKTDHVRVVGNGHCFNRSMENSEAVISLKKLNKIYFIDAQTKRIKVEGGISLKKLNRILFKNKLCLPNLGNIDSQSLAGLLAHASHGSVSSMGTLCEHILEIEMVLADGSLQTFKKDDSLFSAACVSLGALGVIYSVTLQCEDSFALLRKEKILPLTEAIEFKRTFLGYHLELWYLPFTTSAIVVTMDKISKPRIFSAIQKKVNEAFVGNFFMATALKVLSKKQRWVPRFMQLLEDNFGQSSFSGWSHQMFKSLRLFRGISIEMALDESKLHEGLLVLYRLIEKHAQEKKFFLNLPVNIRFVSEDRNSLLSPAVYRNTCYIECISYWKFKGLEAFFREVETEFLALGARSHWGKLFYQSPLSNYPEENVSFFEEIRKRLDPKNKFLNNHLKNVISLSSPRFSQTPFQTEAKL